MKIGYGYNLDLEFHIFYFIIDEKDGFYYYDKKIEFGWEVNSEIVFCSPAKKIEINDIEILDPAINKKNSGFLNYHGAIKATFEA